MTPDPTPAAGREPITDEAVAELRRLCDESPEWLLAARGIVAHHGHRLHDADRFYSTVHNLLPALLDERDRLRAEAGPIATADRMPPRQARVIGYWFGDDRRQPDIVLWDDYSKMGGGIEWSDDMDEPVDPPTHWQPLAEEVPRA